MSSTDTLAGPSTRSESPTAPGRFPLPRLGTIVVLLVALALVLRLWELGERPLHHDESLDAWWSWLFREGKYDGYDPVYHGPLRFYVTAGLFEVFGESEAIARLFSALTGTAVVGLPWFLRKELGRAGTIAAAVALCISPTMLYYSRFGREDAQMVFLTLLSLVLGLAYLRRPRIITASALSFVIACSFAIKESTYLFGLLLAVYVLIVIAAQFDAQRKAAVGLTSDPDKLDAPFFSSALILASVGLLLAVVIGAASDELFPMLALYALVLVAFTAATALPQLRSAELKWTLPSAALWVTTAAAVAATVRVLRSGPAPWDLSAVAIGLTAVLGIGALALVTVPAMRSIPAANTWAVALGIGAVGLGAREWFKSELADELLAPAPTPWSISPLAVAVGALLIVAGVIVLLAEPLSAGLRVEPIPLASTTWASTFATAGILAGLALLINEYLEIQDLRWVAALAIFITIFGAATLLIAAPRVSNDDFVWPPLVRAFGAIGWLGWFITLAVFAVTWFLFFTVWGNIKQDWASGFTEAIDYWDSQQEVNRGGQPWYYYLFALPAYEWLFVALGAIGSWRALRRPTVMTGLFVWFAIGSLILYSYAGERMPWLIAHPLLPVLILAGLGAQELWQHRTHRLMPGIATFVALGLVLTIGTSIRASFPNGADSREILSQAGQATPHLTAALERLDNIDRIKRQQVGEGATLAIGTANAWPYNWYLRDRPNVMWFNNDDGPPTDGSADVIIVDSGIIDPATFPDYQPTLFAMRSWWVPTYTQASPFDWLSYARGRDLWEQGPNPNFFGISEVPPTQAQDGLRATLKRLQNGANDASDGLVSFSAADGDYVPSSETNDEFDDGRDGCGSVDQWFMVRNEFAFTESQVYPDPIARMGPLDCASDLLATS